MSVTVPTTSLQQLFGGGGAAAAPARKTSTESFAGLHETLVNQAAAEAAPPAPTSLQLLFGGSAAPPPVHPAVDPKLASTPIDESKLEAWEGMYFDTSTGEAIVLQNRDSELGEKRFLHTGWFFERPTQNQPTPGGSLEDRSHQARLSPFGFLTAESTARLMDLLGAALPPGAKIEGIGANDANAAFPVSTAQREIHVSWGGRTHRFPAGNLARTICNYTYVDGQGAVRQNSQFTLTNAVGELTLSA